MCIEGFPTSDQFAEHHIKPQQPIKMTGAAKQLPAYHKWTDEYLVAEHGNKWMNVEPKKEHRTMSKTSTRMWEFIDFYTGRNVYSVTSLDRDMKYVQIASRYTNQQ